MKLYFTIIMCLCLSTLSAQTFDEDIIIYLNEEGGIQNSIAAADFDNDGLKDVLMAGSSPNVFWVKNLGDNNFGPKIIIFDDEIFGERAKPIDINNDGNMDIAAACSFSNVVVTILGNGDGSFQQPVVLEDGLEPLVDLKIFDVDLDGFEDIVFSTHTNIEDIGRIYLSKNNGNGSFIPRKIIAPEAWETSNIEFADLDNDQLPDLISKSFWDDKFTWYKNLANGDFSQEIEIRPPLSSLGARALFPIDIDDDNDIDLLCYEIDNLGLYKNDGSGNFLFSNIDISSFVWGLTASDFDHDGDIDIFCGSGEFNTAVILHGNGDGSYQEEQVVANDIGNIIDFWVTDMDADGVQDILTASSLYDGYLLFINGYDGPLSSYNFYNNLEVRVYPNPTSDKVTIETDEPLELSFEVLDISGKMLIYERRNKSSVTEISLEELGKGIYAMIIRDDSGILVSKFKILKK